MDILCVKNFDQIEAQLRNIHVVKGCAHMSVEQVRKMRAHLLKTGADSFKNCQLWLMIILSIKLFMRADEVVKLDLSQFRTECAEVDKESKTVNHIVVAIQGKTDKKFVSLSLWRDDEYPEFCPIRALLTYLGKANLKEGVLFPQWDELQKHLDENTGEPGTFREPASYYYLKNALKV